MQFLEWEDSYNIGVKEIDIQHRGLFDIISKLSATRRFETEGRYFLAMLHQLVDYTKIHFATEERYMREAQYPKLVEHQQEHTVFITELMKLLHEFEKKEPDIQQKILNYLKVWYMEHIMGTDRDYQKSLKDKGFT
jgi:hemerythrin